MEEILQYLEVIQPYIPYVAGLVGSWSITRSIRIYRMEEGKPQLKTWETRAVAFVSALLITTIVYWMVNDKSLDSLIDGTIWGSLVGLISPAAWQFTVLKLKQKYPDLDFLNKVHPNDEIRK